MCCQLLLETVRTGISVWPKYIHTSSSRPVLNKHTVILLRLKCVRPEYVGPQFHCDKPQVTMEVCICKSAIFIFTCTWRKNILHYRLQQQCHINKSKKVSEIFMFLFFRVENTSTWHLRYL